jgi:cysteinyl-tRNA synthetase
MSKSLGNFVTIHELLATVRFGDSEWDGDELRLAILRTHYRQPLDFTVNALKESRNILRRWRRIVSNINQVKLKETRPPQKIVDLLYDDLATPSVITLLHSLA